MMRDIVSENIITDFEDMDKEEQEHALVLIVMICLHSNNLLYAAFKDDLLYKNRYLPTKNMRDLLDAVATHQKLATKTIRKGSIFYRARILDDEFRVNRLNELLNSITTLPAKELLDLRSLKYLDDDLFYIFLYLYLDYISTNPSDKKSYFVDDKFIGYDAKNSGVAPPDKTAAGRLNPEKINYLYTAKRKYTAVCEVKPYIGQSISVAKLTTNRTLRMLDLSKLYPSEKISFNTAQLERTHILNIISKEFSKPNHNNSSDYLPTQYITEYAKEILKYDGIYFRSSLDSKGINAVFFDSNTCDILSSEIVHIKNIKLSY